MASQKTIAEALMMTKAFFPNEWKDTDIKASATAWALTFRDVPDADFTVAYSRILKRAKFSPKPGDLEEELKRKHTAKADYHSEWATLIDACEKINDLRTEFGYTYIPEGETRTQGEMARDEAQNVFRNLPPAVRNYIGSYSALLQFAHEIGSQDSVGLSIRYRDFETARRAEIDGKTSVELLEEGKAEAEDFYKNLLEGDIV